jgi:hypothetical protein
MIKVSGFDELSRQLQQALAAIAEIDGDLGDVAFDPNDPGSIEAAIQHAEALIDSRIQPWAENPLVAQLVDEMKVACRVAIIDRAAQARLEGGQQ